MILLFLCGSALAVVPTVRQHSPVVITQKRVITTALCCRVQVHHFDRREASRRSTKRLEKVRRRSALALSNTRPKGAITDAAGGDLHTSGEPLTALWALQPCRIGRH